MNRDKGSIILLLAVCSVALFAHSVSVDHKLNTIKQEITQCTTGQKLSEQ